MEGFSCRVDLKKFEAYVPNNFFYIVNHDYCSLLVVRITIMQYTRNHENKLYNVTSNSV